MKILVTGARGFIGKNLVETLKNIRDNKDRTRNIAVSEVFACGRENSDDDLRCYCSAADVVIHLAGVNRPERTEEFIEGNVEYLQRILNYLEEFNPHCPVILSSSIQANLEGRFAGSLYGKSKLEAEKTLKNYCKKTAASGVIYRLPGVFGKWCRPNYNSVVATFCNNVANDLPIRIDDSAAVLELVYIDDVVDEIITAIGKIAERAENSGVGSCVYETVPVSHKVTLGRIAELLREFSDEPTSLHMPRLAEGSFDKKLYSTYLSYLPAEKIAYALNMKKDERGSFTELMKTKAHGQMSVSISKPKAIKGQHWHHSKWELFIVVSGHGLIQERRVGSDEIIEFEVSGEKIEAVHMLPGYTHNIINLSDTENLVTVMWANELFDPEHPDTFSEKVDITEE